MQPLMKTPAKVTPLWIVAAFVTLTEVVLGYAITQVRGGVQVALTVFVIAFALLVACAFFLILWNRPYVFYPPSEYGSIDPKAFVSALRPEVPPKIVEQAKLVASVERDPADEDAQFRLIDSMLDDTHGQHLILMHENSCDLPFGELWFGHRYEIEYENGGAAVGSFDGRNFLDKLEGTGFVNLLSKGGAKIELTESGHRFSQWLVGHNLKATFMHTPLGGRGQPKPGGTIIRSREEQARRAAAKEKAKGAP
jgi:hypothetical protein